MTAEDLPDDLIDLKTAALIAKCNTQAVFRWVAKGKLQGWRRVGRVFVSRQAVVDLFKPISKPAKEPKGDPALDRLRKRGIAV